MSRKLHIGGRLKVPGWELLNIAPAPYVDHLGNARDLSRFKDNTFTDIYASHVLEHFDYANELETVLKEWYRVLVPGGNMYVSVPDLDILAQLFTAKDRLNLDERFFVMRMMFGGHVNEHDYHVVGLNEEFLSYFMTRAGFVNIRRVSNFSLFNDTSNMVYKGVFISLNVIAEKPDQDKS